MVMGIEPSPLTVLAGIDPGGHTLGLSYMSVDVRNGSIVKVDSMTIESDKLPDGMDGLEVSHSERFNRLYRLQVRLVDEFTQHKPTMVICESPFFNRFRPMAYGSLSELLSMIRVSVMLYDNTVPFKTYSPSEIKKGIHAGHISDKKAMQNAIKKLTEITDVLTKPITQCSEHEIDAIAACYTHLNLFRTYLKGELKWYNLRIL